MGKKKVVTERRLLTEEQLLAILAAVPDRGRLGGLDLRFLIWILVNLGLRISEALGLKWSDINWEIGELHVQRRWYRGDLSEDGTTKTENSCRKMQMGPLVNLFRQHYPGPHARDQHVFIGDDGVMPPDERDLLRYVLRPALKRLKLYYPGFGWHAFRRQNITWRQQKGGATPFEAPKAAGHGSLDTTYDYSLVIRNGRRRTCRRYSTS